MPLKDSQDSNPGISYLPSELNEGYSLIVERADVTHYLPIKKLR